MQFTVVEDGSKRGEQAIEDQKESDGEQRKEGILVMGEDETKAVINSPMTNTPKSSLKEMKEDCKYLCVPKPGGKAILW